MQPARASTMTHDFTHNGTTLPRDLDVNVFPDILIAHSSPEIKKWLAHTDN